MNEERYRASLERVAAGNLSTGREVFSRRYSHTWSGVIPRDPQMPYILRSAVRPLFSHELQQVIDVLAHNQEGKHQDRREALENVRARNKTILAEIQERGAQVNIVLDARSDGYEQGWLGDMLESSRLISFMKDEGFSPRVITTHPNVFSGNEDDIQVIPISGNVTPKPRFNPNTELLTCIGKQAKMQGQEFGYALYPTNAYTPIIIKVNHEGQVMNHETFRELGKGVKLYDRPSIPVNRWSSWYLAVHQLQALQAFAYLVGFDSAASWDAFPDQYIRPSAQAKAVAEQSARLFVEQNAGKNTVILHPGTALDGNKSDKKLYAEEGWRIFIADLIGRTEVSQILTILKPANQEHAEMAKRLRDFTEKEAAKNGRNLDVHFFPKGLEAWDLATFIWFLRRLPNGQSMLYVGLDSMPAHAAAGAGFNIIQLASPVYSPVFFAPDNHSITFLPTKGDSVCNIPPSAITDEVIYHFSKRTARRAH